MNGLALLVLGLLGHQSPAPQAAPQSLLEHQSFVRELARRLLRDEDAAEDLAQETMTRWIERAPSLKNPRAWLRRVTHNLASHHLRSRSNRSAREEEAARPEALASAAEEAERASVLRSVVDAVLSLEEPYRTTVLLRYFRGWKAKRVASSMNLPEATVRTRERRALAMLRGQLDEAHGDRERWVSALAPLALALSSPLAAQDFHGDEKCPASTALGGAVAGVRDAELLHRMQELDAERPVQATAAFLRRVAAAAGLLRWVSVK